MVNQARAGPRSRARGLGPGSSTGLVEATIIGVAPKRPGKKEGSRQKRKQQAKNTTAGKKKTAGKQEAVGKKEYSREERKQQAKKKAAGIF